jgi:DNA-directed RNA polymerase specialized sigma24 family protein
MVIPASEIIEKVALFTGYEEDVFNRVRHYTYRRFGRYRQRIHLDGLILDAFIAVRDGVRHLPADEDPVPSLCMIVKSKVGHWLEKEKRHKSLEDIPDWCHSEDMTGYYLLCYALREAVRGDATLMRMVELLIQYPNMKPQDFVSRLGMPIKEVYKARERLARKTLTLRKEWIDV